MTEETTTMRRCIGSARFGIEPHEAPIEEFPKQPSRKDGLGRMCRTHWNEYTRGLAREAKKATGDGTTEPKQARKRRDRAMAPLPGSQGDAG